MMTKNYKVYPMQENISELILMQQALSGK